MKIKYNRYIAPGRLLLTVLLLDATVGCSGDHDGRSIGETEIVLQSVTNTETGTIHGEATGFSVGDTLFFARGNTPGVYGDTWKACLETGGRTELLETHYYPADNSPVYLRGYYPGAQRSTDNRLHYTLDGSQDLMLSNEQSGRLTDMFWQETKSFRFEHLLTQLRFEVKADSTAWEKGLVIRALQIGGSRRQAVLDLEKEQLAFEGETGLLTAYSESEPDKEMLRLDTTFTVVPGRVTVEPGVSLFLTLRTQDAEGREVSYERMPVFFHTPDGVSGAGVSYLLRVTLDSEAGLKLWSEVTPWQQGGNGNGIIYSLF